MQINSITNMNQSYPGINNQVERSGKADGYFTGLKKKFPDVSMNKSNNYFFSKDSATTLNISPEYLRKAENQPEIAKNVERLAGLARAFPQYLGTHNTMPDGTKVAGVSFVVDENGGVSCNCTYESRKQSDSSGFLDKILKRREEKREAEREREEKDKSAAQVTATAEELNLKYTEYFTGAKINYL